jgi:excisionase family DNA binding protein
MSGAAGSVADTRERLRRLEPLIGQLEDAGQLDDAAAVRLARDLAEHALEQRPRAETPVLLTTRQAGRALGVSIQTIRNWVTAGRLPAEKRGVRTMIPRQALLEEIERSRVHPVDGERSPEEQAAIVARRQQLLAALPPEIVGPLDALHEKMERGEPLTPDEQGRIVALEHDMAKAAARILTDEIERLRSGKPAA